MSDKKSGKKVKKAATVAAGAAEGAVVSDLTQRPGMKKKGK